MPGRRAAEGDLRVGDQRVVVALDDPGAVGGQPLELDARLAGPDRGLVEPERPRLAALEPVSQVTRTLSPGPLSVAVASSGAAEREGRQVARGGQV